MPRVTHLLAIPLIALLLGTSGGRTRTPGSQAAELARLDALLHIDVAALNWLLERAALAAVKGTI